MTKTPRRRLERMQGTLMKMVAQLESCKMMMDDTDSYRAEPEQEES